MKDLETLYQVSVAHSRQLINEDKTRYPESYPDEDDKMGKLTPLGSDLPIAFPAKLILNGLDAINTAKQTVGKVKDFFNKKPKPFKYLTQEELITDARSAEALYESYRDLKISYERALRIHEFSLRNQDYYFMEYVNYKVGVQVYNLETGKLLKEDVLNSFIKNIHQLPGSKLKLRQNNRNSRTIHFDDRLLPTIEDFPLSNYPTHAKQQAAYHGAMNAFMSGYSKSEFPSFNNLKSTYDHHISTIKSLEKRITRLMKEKGLDVDQALEEVKRNLEMKHVRKVKAAREIISNNGEWFNFIEFDEPVVIRRGDHLESADVYSGIVLPRGYTVDIIRTDNNSYITVYGGQYYDVLSIYPCLDMMLHELTRFASNRYEYVRSGTRVKSAFAPI